MGNTSSTQGGGVISLGPPKPLYDSPPPPELTTPSWQRPSTLDRPRPSQQSGRMTPSRPSTLDRPRPLQPSTQERPSSGYASPKVTRDPKDFPIFSPEARDPRMKGRKYGHFSKKIAQPKSPGEKENIRTFFDRNAARDKSAIQTPRTMMSGVTTPGTSAFPSRMTSAFNSKVTSRSGSLHYKRKKYRAPQPPFPRPSSPDSFASSSDGLRQMHQRKKRRAPPPPSQKPVARAVEPPVDYSDDEMIKTTDVMDIDEDDIPPPPAHSPPPPPVEDVVAVIPPPPALDPPPPAFDPPPPPPAAPELPPPPPPPPPITETPSAVAESSPVVATAPKSRVHRLDSVLRKDIVRAAEERAMKGPVPLPEPRKSNHQIFAEELSGAYSARQKRRVHGTVKLRTTGRSWVFHAKKKKTHTMILRNLRDKIEPAEEEENKTDDEFDPDDETLDDADWIPEQDLQEDVEPFEEASPTEALTARTGNFYDYLPKPAGSKQEPEKPVEKTKDGVLNIYKKKVPTATLR